MLPTGGRISCLWVDFGDESDATWQLQPLRHAANVSLSSPDLVVLGFGAWWVWHRPQEPPARFAQALASQQRAIDELFTSKPPRSPLYFGTLARPGAHVDTLYVRHTTCIAHPLPPAWRCLASRCLAFCARSTA